MELRTGAGFRPNEGDVETVYTLSCTPTGLIDRCRNLAFDQIIADAKALEVLRYRDRDSVYGETV